MPKSQTSTISLHPIGDYKWPTLPAQQSVNLLLSRLRKWLKRDENQPLLGEDKLQTAEQDDDFDISPSPVCEPIQTALSNTLDDWWQSDSPDQWVSIIILPPHSPIAPIMHWASGHESRLIEPPDRASLLSESYRFSLDGPEHELLVIEDLSQWFLRHINGLGAIKSLMHQLSQTQRHCLVGCSSWSWAFLSQALAIDANLPTPRAMSAFDGDALQEWIGLASSQMYPSAVFRLANSGYRLLEPDNDSESDSARKASANYFKELAAKSLGIPWIAWAMWQNSLRTQIRNEDKPTKLPARFDDEHVLWVVNLDDLSLPEDHNHVVKLILHALLLHRGLSHTELALVMPECDIHRHLPRLVNQGLVESVDGQFFCTMLAYPSIRRSLNASGFPLDTL